jgi:hypothetical protein
VTAPTGFRPGPFAWTPDSRAVLAIKNCAASTIFAGARQLFLPVQGQQRNPANPLARLGDDGPVGGLIGTRERRSADRRGGAHRGSGDHGAGRTRTSQRRPDHRVASVAAPA